MHTSLLVGTGMIDRFSARERFDEALRWDVGLAEPGRIERVDPVSRVEAPAPKRRGPLARLIALRPAMGS